MTKGVLLPLAFMLASLPASPQTFDPPIQTAQASDKREAAVQESVVLPERAAHTRELIGAAIILGIVLLLGTEQVSNCDHGGDCGGPGPIATTTGTR